MCHGLVENAKCQGEQILWGASLGVGTGYLFYAYEPNATKGTGYWDIEIGLTNTMENVLNKNFNASASYTVGSYDSLIGLSLDTLSDITEE